MAETPDDKQMKLRYAGQCRLCDRELPARTVAMYERKTKTVRCVDCAPEPAVVVDAPVAIKHLPLVEAQRIEEEGQSVQAGSAGLSARREYERRHAKHEESVRAKHPKLGGLILAFRKVPQSMAAWDTGALGEERLGAALDKRSSPSLRVLHDRRIPGTRANIDHIAVTPSGIFVIDAKRYVGKRPTRKMDGGRRGHRTETLMVGGRSHNKLVDGVLKQVQLVQSVVSQEVPVTGVLCFIESSWPVIGGEFTTRRVLVTWPKRLYTRLAADGPLGPVIEAHHRSLAEALPPA